MPLPTEGWPPRLSSGNRSIHVLIEGTATTSYEDNAYLFIDQPGANPYKPTPFVAPGDEKLPTPITPTGPGNPLGTGRNPNDSVFTPNVFKRGVGAGTAQTTFTTSGDTVTYTDLTATAPFDRGMINREFVVRDATSAGNNGTFVITGVPTPNSITYENATGVVEDFPVTGSWRLRLVQEGPPKAAIWSCTIRVINLDNTNSLYFSFNGTDDMGFVPPSTTHVYRKLSEAGIAVRASAATADFVVEAW